MGVEMTGPRTLIVLRHAKAAQDAGVPDRERPLTERGERDAVRAGAEIRALGLEPDLVICSPSRRTTRTAELAFPGVEVDYQRDVYGAWPEELLEIVRRADPERRTVVLCGHNPGALDLAMQLTGGDFGFRPGAFAVMEVESAWAELWPGGGRLVTLWDPKEP
ncbi:histidine phosphatase family protein [Nonomuraea sp. ATR24]|uniref:SixA phosphatase family protein n=2 Tax=Nonomuraea TaxID=83681 RepID=UPI0035C2687D